MMTSREKQIRGVLHTWETWWNHTHHRTPWTDAIPEDIRDYRDWLLQNQYKPATIRRHLLRLREVFTEQVGMDPTAGIRPPAEAPLQPQSLTRTQKNALLRVIAKQPREKKALRDMAIAQLMLHAGLRTAEVLQLTRQDIRISPRGGQATIQGKGMKLRTVPLNRTAREALLAWLTVAPAQGRIFPISDRVLRKAFAQYGQQAGIPFLHPHMLRHTCAHDLISSGTPLPTVASLLGHQSLHTTYRYTIPGLADLEKATARLEVT